MIGEIPLFVKRFVGLKTSFFEERRKRIEYEMRPRNFLIKFEDPTNGEEKLAVELPAMQYEFGMFRATVALNTAYTAWQRGTTIIVPELYQAIDELLSKKSQEKQLRYDGIGDAWIVFRPNNKSVYNRFQKPTIVADRLREETYEPEMIEAKPLFRQSKRGKALTVDGEYEIPFDQLQEAGIRIELVDKIKPDPS